MSSNAFSYKLRDLIWFSLLQIKSKFLGWHSRSFPEMCLSTQGSSLSTFHRMNPDPATQDLTHIDIEHITIPLACFYLSCCAWSMFLLSPSPPVKVVSYLCKNFLNAPGSVRYFFECFILYKDTFLCCFVV